MSYQILYTSSLVSYDSLKDTLVIDDVWQGQGEASISAKSVSTMAGGMPVRIACNTISSLTFGGSVRGWTVSRARKDDPVTHEIDLDDWRVYLDRQLPVGRYTSVAVDSVVRALVAAHTTSFTVDVHSYFNAGLTSAWPAVSVAYRHDCTLSAALDSLMVMAQAHVNYDQTQPPRWGVGPDRVVRAVGYANSYGTTVAVDDADLDLRGIQVGMIANQMVSRVWVWAGSTNCQAGAAAGASSLAVDERERFYGNPNSLSSYEGALCYLANGSELIPVVSSVAATGYGNIGISTLNIHGVQHGAITATTKVRAVLMQPAATDSLNVIGSLTGESPYWDRGWDGVAAGYGNATYPSTWTYLANALLRLPGAEVGFLKVWTVNSQVASGGRLAVSLTAAGVVPGVYPIQRVRIAGFDRGESIAPVYEVEAGPEPRYRVDSLL